MTNETTNKLHPYSQVLQWVAEGKEIESGSGERWIHRSSNAVLNAAQHFGDEDYCQPQDFRLKPQRYIHQELIDAYTKGAEIQMYIDCIWEDVEPQWATNRAYRIKPEPKPDFTETLSNTMRQGWVKVSKPTCFNENIKVTRCGETNKIKSVEIIEKKHD